MHSDTGVEERDDAVEGADREVTHVLLLRVAGIPQQDTHCREQGRSFSRHDTPFTSSPGSPYLE